MFTFMINDGCIVEASGIPDIIIRTCDYEKFLENVDEFDTKFPNNVFGCVESTNATYNLSEENRVVFADDDTGVGVYYGICTQ